MRVEFFKLNEDMKNNESILKRKDRLEKLDAWLKSKGYDTPEKKCSFDIYTDTTPSELVDEYYENFDEEDLVFLQMYKGYFEVEKLIPEYYVGYAHMDTSSKTYLGCIPVDKIPANSIFVKNTGQVFRFEIVGLYENDKVAEVYSNIKDTSFLSLLGLELN